MGWRFTEEDLRTQERIVNSLEVQYAQAQAVADDLYQRAWEARNVLSNMNSAWSGPEGSK